LIYVITTLRNTKHVRVMACEARSSREETDMRFRWILRSIASVAATLLSTSVVADPVDLIQLNYGAATGALAGIGRQTLRDGLDLHFGLEDYIANKDYTFQIVLPGSGEKSESYIQFAPTKTIGFASALATGGNLEVGSELKTGGSDFAWAVSRTNLHIKNSIEDQSLDSLR